jgi:hypothetical protein
LDFKKKAAAVLVSVSMAGSAAVALGNVWIHYAHAAAQFPAPAVTTTRALPVLETGHAPALPSPFTPCRTVAEMSARLGFVVTVPRPLQHVGVAARNILGGDTAQIDYKNGVMYRMARGTDDISGDYRRFDKNRKTWHYHGLTVHAKGDEKGFRSVTWTDGTYTYALLSPRPLPQDVVNAYLR